MMKNEMMRVSRACGMFLGLSLLLACSRDEVEMSVKLPEGDFLELEPRMQNVETGKICRIDQMDKEDIIVAVNGYPYRRRIFDEQIAMATDTLARQPDANSYLLSEQIEERKRRMVPEFVTRRLLLDEARRLKLVSDAELRQQMASNILAVAKKAGITPEKAVLRLGANKKYLYYEMAERIIIDRLVRAKIPPKIKVDAAFVSNVQAQVVLENLACQKTNDLIRVRMLGWKKDIAAGKAKFEDLANKYSHDASETIGKDGVWGSFERSEIQNRVVARTAFSLSVGEISDPIEDEDGYHLVKVLAIKPAEKNSKGRVIQKEIRQLAHIYIEKEPELIRQTDEEMFKDLKQQMQMQAIYQYADVLRTNGVNSVIYPHGERLFQ